LCCFWCVFVPYINAAHVQQLPFESQFQLATSYDGLPALAFRALPTSRDGAAADSAAAEVAVISSRGLVQTGTQAGTVTVLVTHHARGWNQTVAVVIEVAAVASLSLVPSTVLYPPSASTAAASIVPHFLPLGATVRFVARLHDAAGRAFHATDDVTFASRAHRHDGLRARRLTSAEAGSVPNMASWAITATSQGATIWHVSVAHPRHPSVSDYVRIRVTSAIVPGLRLYVERVCYGGRS
jgi:hypothetical protein